MRCFVANFESGRASRENRGNESAKSTCASRTVSLARVGGLRDCCRDFSRQAMFMQQIDKSR